MISGRRIFFSPPPPFPSFHPRTYCKGYYFYSPQSSPVIKSKMVATTTLRIRTRFRPPKIRLHCGLYSRLHFTFYQTTLPGKRDTKVRETVSTDMRILSASGSKMVPKTDFWFLKFLAMKPSSYKKKMWILTFKALMAASLTSDSYLMHRLEDTCTPLQNLKREWVPGLVAVTCISNV